MILTLLLPAIETICNRALLCDRDALDKIQSIQHQVIKIECVDWNMIFYIIPDENGLQFHATYSSKTDTVIQGKLSDFLALFMKGATTASLFQHPVTIEGNTHTIEVLRDAFKNIDIDWEARLSHFVGDVLAHKICRHVKNTKNTIEKSAQTVTEQTKEFIFCEAKNLISQKQAEHFYQDVHTLRHDVERMDARINRLITS